MYEKKTIKFCKAVHPSVKTFKKKKKKENEPTHNTKDRHQMTRERNERGK